MLASHTTWDIFKYQVAVGYTTKNYQKTAHAKLFWHSQRPNLIINRRPAVINGKCLQIHLRWL